MRKIIVVSFYAPPGSCLKAKMIDHLLTNLTHLMAQYESCGVYICGDKNDLNIAPILAFNGTFKQIVNKTTRKDNISDIIITNCHQYYNDVTICNCTLFPRP